MHWKQLLIFVNRYLLLINICLNTVNTFLPDQAKFELLVNDILTSALFDSILKRFASKDIQTKNELCLFNCIICNCKLR